MLPPRHLPTSLASCKYIFVRNDAHRTPLTRPYRGPYLVVDRNPKAYRLRVSGRLDWVSIDRLKPAYLEDDDPGPALHRAPGPASVRPPADASPPTSPPVIGPRPVSTRAGRTVRPLCRLNL